jgi:hypothetical protein
MTADELLAELDRLSLRLVFHGSKLLVRGHRELFSDGLIIDQLRRHKPLLLAAAKRFPRCCICCATVWEPLLTSWGGKPCHRDCGEAAFQAAKAAGEYGHA